MFVIIRILVANKRKSQGVVVRMTGALSQNDLEHQALPSPEHTVPKGLLPLVASGRTHR